LANPSKSATNAVGCRVGCSARRRQRPSLWRGVSCGKRASCGRHDRHHRSNRRRIAVSLGWILCDARPSAGVLSCLVLFCVIVASCVDADRGRPAGTLDEIPVDPLCRSSLARAFPLRRALARAGGVMSRRVPCPFPCKTPDGDCRPEFRATASAMASIDFKRFRSRIWPGSVLRALLKLPESWRRRPPG